MTVHTESAVGARADTLEIYDFDRPTALARDQVRLLHAGLDSFARQWQTQMTARLRLATRITLGDIHLATYDEYVETIPGLTAMVLCGIEPLAARMVVQFPITGALSWISRLVGGELVAYVPVRELTLIEQSIVRSLVRDALDVLEYTMGEILPVTPTIESVRFGARTAQAAATTDSMVIAEFSVATGEVVSDVTLAIPAEALLDHLDLSAAAADHSAVDLMVAQLTEVPVRVSLTFQPTSVRPEVVLSLAEGDLIRTGHSKNKPLTLSVEGQELARAAVGTSGAQLACVIVDTREGS